MVIMRLYCSANPRQSLLVTVLLLSVTTSAFPVNGAPTVYKNKTEFYEGDDCEFPGTPRRTGVCRKAAECRRGTGPNAVHCEFSVHDAVVCCPTSDGVGTNRFMAGIAKQECDGFQSRSGSLADHIAGNRNRVALDEFPFMGHLNYGGDSSDVDCGAALISKRFLLTAAHCVKSFKPVSVTLGAVDKNDDGASQYLIKQIHVHERYKKKQNDLAVIELQQDVMFDAHQSPICLNNDLQDIDPAVNLTVMGWGLDGSGSRTNYLFKATVNRVNLEQCRAMFNAVMLPFPTGDKIMCAIGEKSKVNDEYTDTCQGDSGGPLIMSVREKFYLVGVVAFGATCGGSTPGVYTRVSHYIDWIEQKVWGGRIL
uniref:Peptidase S1 domain-containing protein n=1 Tax=Anopheles atroparvus TaxID=41427 RepID=A0AAG5DNZ6_ANOAO